MSLSSIFHSNWWEELDHPHSLVDQYFGDGIHHDVLHEAHRHPRSHAPLQHVRGLGRCPMVYQRPWAVARPQGVSTVKPHKDSFHVSLDVQQFAPEEISVKLLDGSVIVEGKHDDKKDEHGWVSRQFCRRYQIPEQCDIEQVQSTLSSDGVLSIIVPRKVENKVEGEKTIPIIHTGKPAIVDTPKSKKESLPENSH
ncbi:protein lethal(2)essential for life-like [Fopius arisanus]|uniref:Protein lethal(2)essential for life-like n=1 Tax=Fopius arisanus TaxID=64838 RepID=A0A9R1SWH4_9HYME|nr:PREDICTED: protein lethal(2)essential for life-like [Fopius arisanus]